MTGNPNYVAPGSYTPEQDAQNKAWREEYKRQVDAEAAKKPTRPGYQGITGTNGKLANDYRIDYRDDVGFNSNLAGLNDRLSGINLDKRGLDAIRERALGQGSSPWAQMMLDKEGVERGQRMDETSALGNAGYSKAISSLGARGGTSSASRANLARKAMHDELMSRQGINRQGQLDRLGIQTTDENQKLDLLKGLPGMEINALQPELQKTSMWTNLADSEAQRRQGLDLANRDYRTGIDKFNVTNLIGDRQGQNQYTQKVYDTDMTAWGAERTAQAQENSGK